MEEKKEDRTNVSESITSNSIRHSSFYPMNPATHPLRVLHICQRDDLATGGAARVAVEYVKRLPDYHIDARCLFLYGPPGHFQTELGDRADYLNITDSRDVLHFGRLRQAIRQFQPHILHHHDGLLWSHALTFFHPNQIKMAHAHLGADPTASPLSRSRFASWCQRQSTDLLICITEDTRRSQIHQGGYRPEHTQVLYNGVDETRFYPPSPQERAIARRQFGLPEQASVVGSVGRLHCEMKGTDDFLRVMQLLPPNFWALVVGMGPDYHALKHLAASLEIDHRVIFTGILDTPTVAYHALDLFCLTSHVEPFGLVVAEAMACRIPVLGFACPGGVQEILHASTGWVIADRNRQAMADTILHLTAHPDLHHPYQVEAEAILQHNHSWSKNTATLANWYQMLQITH